MGMVKGYSYQQRAPYLDTGVWVQWGEGTNCICLSWDERGLRRRWRERRGLISPSKGDFPLRMQVVEKRKV